MAKIDFSGVLHLIDMILIYQHVDPCNVKFTRDFLAHLGTLDFEEGVKPPHGVHVIEGYRNEFAITWAMEERPDCTLELRCALDRNHYTVFYSYKRPGHGRAWTLGAAVECFYYDGRTYDNPFLPNAKMHLNCAGDKSMQWLMEEINHFGLLARDPDAYRNELLKGFDDVHLSGNHC